MTTTHDDFPGFLSAILRRFALFNGDDLFHTSATGLYDLFLANLPEDLRQHYNCRACRQFVDRYGGLVAINSAGGANSVLWVHDGVGEGVPEPFQKACRAIAQAVKAADIVGVFLPPTRVLGTPASPPTADGTVWTHINVTVARVHSHPLLSASQVEAERREDFNMLSRALAEFPLSLAERALAILTSGTLYRSEKCIGVAEWFVNLHRSIETAKGQRTRKALIWRAVANAPTGYTHVRSSMIGTLLEDLAAGLDTATVARRFAEKMDPAQYMRAQVAPSAGNIAQAEKAIAGLKASGALSRRFARLSDIPTFVWRPRPVQPKPTTEGNVFGHLTPKTKQKPATTTVDLPTQTMTWEKFARTVLPDVTRLEVQVPTTSARFMALVTAANPDAPPILQWDAEDRRNPVSWYYHGGIDAEMKRRVIAAGGRHEDNDIRVSLMWNNRNDLDLHVQAPNVEYIYYGNKRSRCGGYLDVDMNVGGETTTPVENVRWARGMAPRGRYRVFVRNFRFHERAPSATPFKVELEIGGEVYSFSGETRAGATSNLSDVTAFEFDYVPGQKLARAPSQHAVSSAVSAWNVTPGSWVEVTGVVKSPNLWGERVQPQHGQHTMFLLKDCRDTSEGYGRGLFVETLRGELHSVRATLEAFMAGAKIEGTEQADACGVGMNDQSPWNLMVRVTTPITTATYLIDRFD